MRILMTGRGRSGSWAIRGEQLGSALGAVVKPRATLSDCLRADVIVAVKFIPEGLLKVIRASRKPWVYDIVDAFPQPECTGWSEAQSNAWLKAHVAALAPDAVIWPNERMQRDAGGGGLVLYHHHRPGIAVNAIRPELKVIGYEGSAKFLEGWRSGIEEECARRGARFVVNPANLADVDVVLALRGPQWNGYAQQHWKSNVKLANAHGSGTPFIGMPESGYVETACGAEGWASDMRQLREALDWLQAQSVREEVSARFLQSALTVKTVAAQYSDFLCKLKS